MENNEIYSKKFFDYREIGPVLQKYSPRELKHPVFRPSAVLIPLIPTDQGYDIVITARSSKLKVHRGEMSFPGGRFEPEHDKKLEDTAMRETQEEIGMDPKKIELLGRLDDFPTISAYIIRPFVGVIHDAEPVEFKLSADEVEDLVRVPITFLTSPKVFEESRMSHVKGNYSLLNVKYTSPQSTKTYNIWGATAHLLSMYLNTIYRINITSPNYIRPTVEQLAEYIQEQKRTKK